jgi:hypothetical protein
LSVLPSTTYHPNSTFEFYEGLANFRNPSFFRLFNDNPYSFFGFHDPNSNSFFLTTLKNFDQPDHIFNQINACFLNSTNFSAAARAIADDLDLLTHHSLAIAFATHPSDNLLDPYELPLRLTGTLVFGDHDLELTAISFDLFSFLSAGKVYGVLNALYIVSSFYAWHSIGSIQATHFINALSLHSFILHTGYEFGYGLFMLNIALSFTSLQQLFLICFLCTIILYFQFQMATVTIIWRVSERVTELGMTALRWSLLQFFGTIFGLLFLSLLAIILMLEFPLVPLLFLYSSFVPQIVHSARTGRRKAGDGTFVALTTINRLFVLCYLFVYRANIVGTAAPITAIVVGVYSVVQLVIVVLQNVIGPSFFLPVSLREPLFDYGGVVEVGAVCSICMSVIEEGEQAMVTPCGHEFHSGCLLRWMQEEMVCPFCRDILPEPVNPEQYASG